MMWAPGFNVEVITVFNAKIGASGFGFGHTDEVTEVERAMGLTSIPCVYTYKRILCFSDLTGGNEGMLTIAICAKDARRCQSIEKKEIFRFP